MILHLCTAAQLEAARADGARRPPSLDEVGFVHCSDPGTVHLPAGYLFPGRTDVVVLAVDTDRLAALGVAVRWEPGVGPQGGEDPRGPWFPHVYGPLPLDAVVAVHPLVPQPDGTFRPPPEIAG
ncbi:glutathione S-transferase [Actinomycetospora sp. NBRC 106375]|uniref:DUF952 domain-containing protein n=1 Tax=Actinomycetospora sp. NBRC 106375 TaxID=3032207 RepID=UPI0024A5629C|nr:DUF952 domain-containing protein [Actinomycetospora sp. NBRC 106375]GLZ47621.1 glutathione S-transferase [Actinomycetospora sp. NBRC 106375]